MYNCTSTYKQRLKFHLNIFMFLILEIWHFVLVVNIHISDIEMLLVSTNKCCFIQDKDRPKI